MKKNNLFNAITLCLGIVLFFSLNSNAQTPDFTVAKDGSGDFTTVQAAVDAAPSNSSTRTVIYIKNGTYYEVINISSSKKNITFLGEDVNSTLLTYDNGAKTIDPATGKEYGTSGSRSIQIDGEGFVAINISFENNASTSLGQAVAVKNTADKTVFKNCRFLGNQDTYYADAGRSYHVDCYFEGTTDFIFGGGIAFFENCRIYSKGGTSLTAARTPENVKYGYVFNNCTITGKSSSITDLGRPWRPYASVTYLNSSISNAIKVEGWNNWRNADNELTARFAEYNNTGAGASLSRRVSWMKKLNAVEAQEYNVINVLKATNANPQVIDNWSPFDVLGVSNSDISISLASPIENAGFDENSNITFEAYVSVTNSELAHVTFYSDSILYKDTDAPYSFTWENVKPGIYDIIATATDTSGYTVYTNKITIFVGSGFSITSPADSARFGLPVDIPIKVEAWVNNGTISKVEFFQVSNTLLGTDNTRPYSYSWKNVQPGSYTIYAKATDSNDKVYTSKEINITMAGGPDGYEYCSAEGETCTFNGYYDVAYGVDGKFNYKYNVTGSIGCNSTVFGNPYSGATKACYIQAVTSPVVSITSPTVWNTIFSAPADVTIVVDAIDHDGTIDSVEYFIEDSLTGISTNQPYTYTFKNINAGRYAITAKATDNDGKSSVSSPLNISVVAQNGINDANAQIMLIYPNPVSDELTIKLNEKFSDNLNIIVYNNQGKVVIKKKVTNSEIILNFKELTSGIYMISLNDKNKEVLAKKIIKN